MSGYRFLLNYIWDINNSNKKFTYDRLEHDDNVGNCAEEDEVELKSEILFVEPPLTVYKDRLGLLIPDYLHL